MHGYPITSEATAGRVALESRGRGLFLHRAGHGEPLVLLHGLGESHVGWHPVINTLADHYDVIALDLPGFGRSPSLPGTQTPWGHRPAAAVQTG
jgi:pimeloyl-ACP methyl ester carboxylesterase